MFKEINYQGSTLRYQCTGTGPAVVLLHGFGEHSAIWHHQVPYLQNSFKVIVPDLPGSGRSDSIEDMSLEGLAESVYAVLQHEGVTQCAMVGHSMGGYITLAFAEKHTNVLKGFGLFHSTAYADSEEKKATREKGIQFIQQHGAYAFLKTSIPNLYAPATKENNASLIEEHLQSVQHVNDAALIAYYRSMIARPDRTALLKNTKLPVLFVLGAWDGAVPLKDGLEQCHLPYLSYIHILRASGHMGMVEEVEKSNELLKAYLSVTLQQTT